MTLVLHNMSLFQTRIREMIKEFLFFKIYFFFSLFSLKKFIFRALRYFIILHILILNTFPYYSNLKFKHEKQIDKSLNAGGGRGDIGGTQFLGRGAEYF